MALEITGMTRSFTFKKGHLLPGADHGDGTRTGHQE